MTQSASLIRGEFRRVYDDRYRIALPPELTEPIGGEGADCVLAKEREGCLSLWSHKLWIEKFDRGVEFLESKLQMNFMEREHLVKLQRLVRLWSARSRVVKLGQRGRLLVPEGFREFLAVAPNTELIVVGAGVCVEIWNPEHWSTYLRHDLGEFHALFNELLK
jgi:MraZ protein